MKIIYKNKKAYHEYEILEEFTAGMVLTGAEIKSIRAGHVNLKSAYVNIDGGEAFLKNANVSRYQYDNNPDFDPLRVRKLLLAKKDIEKLAAKLNTRGVTIAALAIGLKGAYAKLLMGLARGKKQHDKRSVLKEKTMEREAQRAMKRY